MDDFRRYAFNLGVVNGTAYLCCVFAGGIRYDNEAAWISALLAMAAAHISAALSVAGISRWAGGFGALSWLFGLLGAVALLF